MRESWAGNLKVCPRNPGQEGCWKNRLTGISSVSVDILKAVSWLACGRRAFIAVVRVWVAAARWKSCNPVAIRVASPGDIPNALCPFQS